MGKFKDFIGFYSEPAADRKFGLNSVTKSYILNVRTTANLSREYRIMYSSIIEIKKTVPGEALVQLREIAKKSLF